ncbi:MAG: NAD-dependent epimerase/dehydratase family protein, partial [Candidatus Micrarchaeales archaeon]
SVHTSIRYTIIRASNMYGPYYETSFNKIFKYIKLGKLRYIGKGTNHMTLVHVDDVVDGIIAALDNMNSLNQTFNLTDGEPYTLKQLFDKAATFLNATPPSKHVHPALAVLRAKIFNINRAELNFMLSDRIVSIAKIKKDLNFHPTRSIDNEGNAMVQEFLKRYRGD